MARPPRLEHVKWVTAKGRTYGYFNTGQMVAGKPVRTRLPELSAPGFWDSYAALKGARVKRAAAPYTVADLAHDFEASRAFRALKPNSQISYSKNLRRVAAMLGKFPVEALERAHVAKVLEREMDGAGSHNLFLSVVGAMYKWARAMEKTAREPTKGISRRETGSHEPWPENVLTAGLAAKDDRTRLAVRLLYYTGQRIGDVLAMRWSDVANDEISIVQEKTGKRVWVPLHSDLRAELAATPKRGMTIISTPIGKPVKDQTLRVSLQKFTAALGQKTVPHGLRKNAVIALLEVGCSVAEVAAITGQTYAVVEYYAKRINQRKLASAAIFKLENKGGTGKP